MYKTVIIGAGRMGRRHINVCKNLNLDLIGLVDYNKESLKIAQQEFNLNSEILYTDLSVLLEKIIPYCAIISTTADSHSELTIRLSNCGVKVILVEKPMATSIDDCQNMINVCMKNKTILGVNHQMRFLEQYIYPKEILNNDIFGGFTSMTVTGGNIGFSMNALHFFEAFRFITNENGYDVTAWFSDEKVQNPRGERFEDVAGSVRVTTKSGKRLYIEIGSDQGNGLLVTYFARNGYITIDELTGDIRIVHREIEYSSLPTTRYGMASKVSTSKIKAVEIIDSTSKVLNDLLINKNYESAYNALNAIKVLVAAYESNNNNNNRILISNLNDLSSKFPWA